MLLNILQLPKWETNLKRTDTYICINGKKKKRHQSSSALQSLYLKQENEASLVAQMVKNLPAMQGIWVQSLGQEDPLEKGMSTHSSIFAYRIP